MLGLFGKSDQEKAEDAINLISIMSIMALPPIRDKFPLIMEEISPQNFRLIMSISGHQWAQQFLLLSNVRTGRKRALQSKLTDSLLALVSNTSNKVQLEDKTIEVAFFDPIEVSELGILISDCAESFRFQVEGGVEDIRDALGKWPASNFIGEAGKVVSRNEISLFSRTLGQFIYSPFNPEVEGKSAFWWR